MVYLHFPSNLTEEEFMLMAKYAKLKKKKKALQALKAPKQEPEKPLVTKRSTTEARDAREIARKLIKSGAIQAIKSPPPLPQNATFKRPRAGRERKLSGGSGPGAGGVASYQPFSASQEAPIDEKATPRVKYLYDSFVTARETSVERDVKPIIRPVSPASPPTEPDTKSWCTTLLVTGALTEEALRRRVATYTVVQLLYKPHGDKGYITFDNAETAARALTDLDGSPGERGNLHASYCRRAARQSPPRQPPLSPKPPQPKPNADRSLLTYDDIFD